MERMMNQKTDAATTQQMLEELKNFDTPSITNVVATYPTSPLCLGLYNPWTENWYTDQTIRCMYPELGRLVGYAVTCVYGLPDPNYNRLTFADVIDALEAMPKPTILVIEQRFPPEIAGKVGLAGGNMVSAMKAIGCVGLISNGPSRDLDEVRPMGFQYMLTGVCAGHGAMAVQAINVPVSVGGMDVAPGEIVHMDENGAVKFPADKLEAVLTNARKLQQEEEARQKALQNAKSAAEIRAILSGHAYGERKRIA
jgi:4-hydroxy-4-methyl-2-oxoglutarate aldolase